MVIISGFGRRGVMTVPAGFRGLGGRGLQEQSNLLHLGKLFVVVVSVEVVEEVLVEVVEEFVHSGGNVGKRSTFNQHPLSPDSAGWASK